MSVVTQFKEALEMTTAPGGLLELTTIERDGVPVKAFAQAPGLEQMLSRALRRAQWWLTPTIRPVQLSSRALL